VDCKRWLAGDFLGHIMAWYNQNALSAQSDIDSLLAQIAANSDASGAYDPVFDAALAEARARASSGNMLSGILAQAQDAEAPEQVRAQMQALYDRYSGFQPIGTLGNIGIGGANTGTIGDTRYNYYTIGSNPGEYQIDPNGFVTSNSTQRDTNYLNPQGIANIGNGQYAFITDPQNVPRMVAPAKDESMAGEAWSAYGPLVMAAAGNIAGPTLNSTFGTLGGSAVKGALSSALLGGNPLTGAAMGGLGSLAGNALSSIGSPSITETTQTLNNPTPTSVLGTYAEYPGGGMDDYYAGLFGDSDPYGLMGWGNETLDPELLRSLGIDTSYNTFLPTSAYNSMMDDQINAPALDSSGNPISAPSGLMGTNIYGSLGTVLGTTGGLGMLLRALSGGDPLAGGSGGSGGTSRGLGGLGSLLGQSGSTGSLLDAFGRAIPGLIGAYGASQQANAINDLAKRYEGYGAPSRARYEASMQPGFDPNAIPGYSSAIDDSMNSQIRALSTQGNPFGNPGGLIEANKKVVAGTALPAIKNYQNQNALFGGLASLNSAVPGLSTSAIGANNNVLSQLGLGAGAAFNPPQSNTGGSLAELLKAYGIKQNNQESLY
jgi:hypothetical protein